MSDYEKRFKGAVERLEKVRTAVANYIATEGCSCCQHHDHEAVREELGKLLLVPKYSDGSGRNFEKFKIR